MATAHQQFSLKWNNYSQHIVNALEELRTDDELTDVTLSCDGRRIKAHKVLLSACSVFFKETFKENPCKHPVVILKGVTFQDLQSVVHFMYNGQVNVSQERLPSFLQTAETLQIKGLTDSNNDKEDSSPSPAPVKKRPQQTFPSQTATAADSVRQDAEARPPTPKRKRVIGTTGGTFTQSAQNSELPGTASVISASGAVGSGSNNNSHHTNNNSAPASLISRNNSDNSVDGLPNVKYEEEHEMDDEYDRDNDNTYQDNGKDVFGGESNSLAAIWARTSGLLGGLRAGAFDDQLGVDSADDVDLVDTASSPSSASTTAAYHHALMIAAAANSSSGLDSGGDDDIKALMLNNSQQSSPNGQQQQGYVCSICGHVSRSAGGRSNHMQTHRDPKICPICHQTFLRRDNLNRHIREKHQGQRRRP